ncbi:MAG TPA: DUF1573 domain-containing protein [Vicinamibacteria bacterium]|nr:DUF1573 domain-containing protein [Vicinamibacteria bacterium]
MRALGLLGAVLLGSALAAAAQPKTAPPQPEARVEPASFDFGKALPGRTLKKEFVLKNAGEATLVIEGVSTTCGCTAAIAGATRLPPGRSTSLSVTLQTRDYRGPVERRVLVRSNDPKTPLLEVRVRATVEPPAGR